MKKTILALLLIFTWSSSGWAITIGTYDFLDYASNGEGKVRMVVDITGNTLSADIYNLSATSTSTGGLNISAITGFAFDFTQSPLTVETWSLQAQTSTDVYKELNDPLLSKNDGRWIVNPIQSDFNGDFTNDLNPSLETNSISVDFLANADQAAPGGIYNPDLMSYVGTDNINFFSKAEFSITFSNTDSLVLQNVYTRMQRVGDKDDSLKLIGLFTAWDDGGGGGGGIVVVPEPATLVLLGVGLIGLGLLQRKRAARNCPPN